VFLALKMSQDPVDGVLLLDASDDFDRPTAATANLNVDIEHALESLGPSHSSMALGRCPYFRICARLKCLATSGRSDFPAPAVIWGKDAVVAGEVDAGLRHQGSQTCDEIHRLECHLRGAIPVGRAVVGFTRVNRSVSPEFHDCQTVLAAATISAIWSL
jgi:hypothetical protein